MEVIENNKIKEKLYVQKLDNGLTVMVFPKKTRKKYIIWSAKVGSIDNKFYLPGEKELTTLPDGIAHYLEHKLFEQENGRNSLDALTSIGVDANAYTTNDHTAFLYECTDHFEEALDEFMDYVQNPYFTDENVEKERGIIEQEIMMYDDYPEWQLYINAMKALYKDNEMRIDVAGTVETIADIDKDKLYKLYNAFYRPDNMVLVVTGDFVPEEILEKIKARITMKTVEGETIRKYNSEQKEIVTPRVEVDMNISMPMLLIAYKDNNLGQDSAKKDLAIDMLSILLFGRSTDAYKNWYESGKLISEPSVMYEFSDNYGHVVIQLRTNQVEDIIKEFSERIENLKKNGISKDDFNRAKKRIYGELVKDYNDVSTISSDLVSDYFKGINAFEYFDIINEIDENYLMKILNEMFIEEYKTISIIK